MQNDETARIAPNEGGRPWLARAAEGFGAGAIAGVCQSLILWVFIQTGAPLFLGLMLAQPLTRHWLYQRAVWGGFWGLLFVLPLLRGQPGWQRGLVLGLAPAAGSLLYFLPYQDGHGFLGLNLGAGMPVIVVAFGLLWGLLAAFFYGRTQPRARVVKAEWV